MNYIKVIKGTYFMEYYHTVHKYITMGINRFGYIEISIWFLIHIYLGYVFHQKALNSSCFLLIGLFYLNNKCFYKYSCFFN